MPSRILKFAAIGGSAFLVDAGVLWAAVSQLDLNLYAARLLSFSAALAFTFLLNRTLTFADRPRRRRAFGAYAAASLLAGAINLGVYSFVVAYADSPAAPVVGLVFGVLSGMAVNFILYNRWVFAPEAGARS